MHHTTHWPFCRYQPVVLSHYTFPKADEYHDVFAPQFVTHCDKVAKVQALPYKDEPMLISYSMADAPLLTDAAVRHRPEGATTWPRVLRNLGSEAPGKQTYVGMLRERHKDIINYGHYGRLAEQAAVLDRWTEKLKKPFLSADGSFSVRSEMLPNPMGPAAENWGQCSEWTWELASGLFARPDVVGWNICGVIEVWKTVPGREKKQHQGIMDPFGKINPGMEAAIRDVSSRLYHIADSQDARATNDRTALRMGEQAPDMIGRKGFIHVERIDGVWFMVDVAGKRFIPTGIDPDGAVHFSPPRDRQPASGSRGNALFSSISTKRWIHHRVHRQVAHGGGQR